MSETNAIVIFGASGDLTRRKLMPSLYDLYRKGRMPENWRIVGVSRTEFSDNAFREQMKSGVKEFARSMYDSKTWAEFAANVCYCRGDLTEFEQLQSVDRLLCEWEDGRHGNRLYYLSIAPNLYEQAVTNLGAADMVHQDHGWRRVVIEKPFGYDLASARALNQAVHKVLHLSLIHI